MAEDRWWTWNGGDTLVGWDYRPMARTDGGLIPLNLETPKARTAWLHGLLTGLPALLGDFAHAAKSNVAAWGIGEGVCEVDWRTTDGAAKLLDFVQKTEALHQVWTFLTLTCLDRNLEPFEIVRGAGFFVNFALTESGALNTAMEDPVYIRVALYADPYAPISRGPEKNDALLAAINGPRLTAFLERIERDVPAQLMELDEAMYRGLVGPHGFLPAPGTPSTS